MTKRERKYMQAKLLDRLNSPVIELMTTYDTPFNTHTEQGEMKLSIGFLTEKVDDHRMAKYYFVSE